MALSITLLILGLGVLLLGGNWLVRGSTTVARWLKIPEIIIGLTIVALGTSAPELVVNITSAVSGSSALAFGNIIGSNIANILLILGIGAIIYPVAIKDSNTRQKDIPFLILISCIIVVFVSDIALDRALVNVVSRTDSLALLGFLVIFMVYLFMGALHATKSKEVLPITRRSILLSLGMIPLGIVCLAIGGDMVVGSATNIARVIGISDRIIGLTIIAIGTSLPELVTTLIAAFHKNTDIVIGNIVGSNILNIIFILGITGLIHPLTVTAFPAIDLLVMVGATILLLVSIYVGKKHVIERWQGGLMLLVYVIYLMVTITRYIR